MRKDGFFISTFSITMSQIRMLFSFLIISSSVFGSFQKDSLQLAAYYQDALIHPDRSIEMRSKIKKLVRSKKQTMVWKESCLFLEARFLVQTGQFETAEKVAKSGLKLVGSKEKNGAKFYNLLGSVAAFRQDYKRAIYYYKLSLELLELNGDKLQAAYIKNNIANTFFSLTDYKSAYTYANEAFIESKELNDTLYMPSIEAILAVSEVKMGKLESAKLHALESIRLSQKYQQPLGLIIGNYSLGEYHLQIKEYQQAEQYYTVSLSIATQFRQSNYIMLANIGLLTVYNATENYKQAVQAGETALSIAKATNNQNTEYSIYKNLAVAYSKIGQPERAFYLMKSAHEIYRKSTSSDNRKSINELLIKYETEKKEKALAKNELQLAQRNQLVAWLSLILLTIVLAVFVLIRRQKSKLAEQEREQERAVYNALVEGEEYERKRLSHEIHDGIQSALVGIQLKLEQKTKERNSFQPVLDQLRKVQEDTRRMAHNLMPVSMSENGWNGALELFCKETATPWCPILIFNNLNIELSKSSPGKVVFRILQELIQNALKHAKASEINVTVLQEGTHLLFMVEDNGIGFDTNLHRTGQGIQSLEDRLLSIHSALFIESSLGKGSVFRFTIPISEFL